MGDGRAIANGLLRYGDVRTLNGETTGQRNASCEGEFSERPESPAHCHQDGDGFARTAKEGARNGRRSIRRIEFGSQDRIPTGRGRFEPVLRGNENLWETSALRDSGSPFLLTNLLLPHGAAFDVISPAFSSNPRNCRCMPHRLRDAACRVESGSGARQ